MAGLLAKTLREVWGAALAFAAAMLIVEALLTFVIPQVQEELSSVWLQMPLARTLLSALLGTEVEGSITAQMMHSIIWVHPVMLAVLWAWEITFCTRFPAGEIDRGTIDVLLGWPVSRRAVYCGESLVWIVSGVLIIACGTAGYLLVSPAIAEDARPALGRVLLVELNLLCVYVAIGGGACLVSAVCDRRGRAVAIVFAFVVASFLLNFLAQFWEPARRVAFLSVTTYYRPAQILMSGHFAASDVMVLLGFGVAAWIVGGEVVARRSMCTV